MFLADMYNGAAPIWGFRHFENGPASAIVRSASAKAEARAAPPRRS
jgi:hypothetical protein